MLRAKPYQFGKWINSLVMMDIISLGVCFLLATELNGYTFATGHITLGDALLLIACFMICLNTIGAYEINRDMSSLRYASEHALAMGAMLVIVFITTYGILSYNESIKPARSVYLLTFILVTPLSLLYRYNHSVHVAKKSAARVFYVIGTSELTRQLQAICQQAHFLYPMQLIHVTTQKDGRSERQEPESTHAGAEGLLREVLTQKPKQCEGVIIDLSTCELNAKLSELLLAVDLHSLPVYPVELFVETFFHKIDLSHVTLACALDGTFIADHQKAYGKLKSLVEGFLAGLLFLTLLPLLFIIALIIKLEDFGPILFTQERVGRFEKPFLVYKFRSMSVHNESDSPLYTATSDSRITKFGRILRLMRLDELPQLWNVIRGEMSIIGPRAEWSKLVEQYQQLIPYYHLRHLVKPGITGWAQVNYGYGGSLDDTLEKLQYDLYYVKHYSLLMDASIVLKTIFTMLSASGR